MGLPGQVGVGLPRQVGVWLPGKVGVGLPGQVRGIVMGDGLGANKGRISLAC